MASASHLTGPYCRIIPACDAEKAAASAAKPISPLDRVIQKLKHSPEYISQCGLCISADNDFLSTPIKKDRDFLSLTVDDFKLLVDWLAKVFRDKAVVEWMFRDDRRYRNVICVSNKTDEDHYLASLRAYLDAMEKPVKDNIHL